LFEEWKAIKLKTRRIKMKTVKKSTIELLAQFNCVRNQLKVLQKAEKAMKVEIAGIMGQENMLEAGNVVITTKSVERTNFDKAALTKEMGAEFVAKFNKKSSYSKMDVTSSVKVEEVKMYTLEEINQLDSEAQEQAMIEYIESI
jgi:hypothetical protein